MEIRTEQTDQVRAWILEQMAETFLLNAFAQACDECTENGVRMPHPNAPGPGQDYADHMPEPSDAMRAAADAAAVALYAAILAAPGGYDPAPALVRWLDADNEVPRYWMQKYGGLTKSVARCWGHYAVMEALGHGVAWSDDNEPLCSEPVKRNIPEGEDCPTCGYVIRHGDGCPDTGPDLGWEVEGDELPAVGDLPGVSTEGITWEDEHMRAVWAKLDVAAAKAEAEREGGR